MTTSLGVDIGATNTKLGLVRPSGRIARLGTFPTGRLTPKALAQRIAEWVGGERVRCAGVGVPAPLDPKREKILWSINLGWRNVPFRAVLRRALRVPVVMENDANVAAFGEYRAGAAKGYRSCALYTLGTGVGGGIVLDGKLLLGDTGFAAELGHVTVQPGGPRCNCGNDGCLESYASSTAMQRRYKELAGRNGVETSEIFRRARGGDRACAKIVDEAARALGIAAAGLAHTVNPSVIVLSGGISKAGEFLFRKVRREARARMFPQCALDIVPGKLEETAGVVGAALWAREKCR